jgi:hypothetical protein
MKYLAKTFIETIPDWAPEELIFNAIAWREGYRFFGCSWDLSRVMMRSIYGSSNNGGQWSLSIYYQ